jgi:RNA polymerase sigma-70 factor (ECF subfamily)
MAGASQLALISTVQPMGIRAEDERLAELEQLYRTHGGRLKSIAWHMVGNRQDAEDAVQETFVKAYRAALHFQGNSGMGTWLCRILINVCHDLRRRHGREVDPEGAALTDRAAPGHEPSLKVALEAALRRIPPKHRMVFLMFEAEGMRHAEIAEALEIPEGTSKAWLFEAKKELKRMLSEARR